MANCSKNPHSGTGLHELTWKMAVKWVLLFFLLHIVAKSLYANKALKLLSNNIIVHFINGSATK